MRSILSIIPLAIVGGVVYAIVRALRRDRHDEVVHSDGMALRRLFHYAMLFAAMVVSAAGISGLLGMALSTGAVRSDQDLATWLALTIVGVPVFAGLARSAWRRLTSIPTEAGSLGWTLYANGALVASLVLAMGSVVSLLWAWIDGDGYQPDEAGMAIVWGALWAGHWLTWRAVPPTRGRDLHVLAGAAIGLGIAAAGAGIAISRVIEWSFDSANGTAVNHAASGLVAAAATAAVGAVVWSWHWLGRGRRLEHVGIWLVYVLLYGVLGGLAATLVGAGRALFLGLQWLWGDPGTTSAAVHFRQLGPAVAAMLVGVAVWRYHRAVVGSGSDRPRSDVDRVYDAIVAGTSLVTMATALTILVVALFRLATPSVAGAGTGRDVLLAAITLLVVGGPLWGVTWARMQRHAAIDADEIASPARRSYLFLVLGASGAVAFGATINLLVVVFQAWLGERTGSLSRPLEVPVALLVTTGAIAVYHFTVVRAERPRREERLHRDVLLVWSGDGEAKLLAELTHASIRVLHRTDVQPGPVDVGAVAAAIEAAEGDHLMVVAGGDDVQVIPYE